MGELQLQAQCQRAIRDPPGSLPSKSSQVQRLSPSKTTGETLSCRRLRELLKSAKAPASDRDLPAQAREIN